jgi:hypothetical protein
MAFKRSKLGRRLVRWLGRVEALLPSSAVAWYRRESAQLRDRGVRTLEERVEAARRQQPATIPELTVRVAPPAQRALDDIGRTEDVRFSPSGRRLAVAGFEAGRILVLDTEIEPDQRMVRITGSLTIRSSALQRPHGLAFIDDETLLVASRDWGVAIFELPMPEGESSEIHSRPVGKIRGNPLRRSLTPGSIDLYEEAHGRFRVLVCGTYANEVRDYLIAARRRYRISYRGVRIAGLDTPDGIAVSPDRRWAAITNHGDWTIRVYANSPTLDRRTAPVAVLRGVGIPHGLRFAQDGRYLVVADYASPALRVYDRGAGEWGDQPEPAFSLRVVEEDAFRSAAHPWELGPKGLAFDPTGAVLAVTSERRPVAFFEVAGVLSPDVTP